MAPSPDGAGFLVRAGDLLVATHPVVKGREHLFELAESAANRAVERTSAAPGEKRVLGIPRAGKSDEGDKKS